MPVNSTKSKDNEASKPHHDQNKSPYSSPLDCLGCCKTGFNDKCPKHNCMDFSTPEQVVQEVDKSL